MKFTSILPSAAQLVRSKCTVTFSMRKRQKLVYLWLMLLNLIYLLLEVYNYLIALQNFHA